MIWNSIPLMTAIDLLIIAVTAYVIWRFRLISRSGRPLDLRIAPRLIVSALLLVCLFYFVDLVSMYVLPVISSAREAIAFMGALHRNFSWLIILFAMIAMSIGFLKLLSEVQKQDARIRRLVDSNIIGIFIWGCDGRIIDANEAFSRIVQYSRDDLVSGRMRWRDMTPAEWRDADDRRVAELKTTGTAQPYEKEYFQKSGTRVPVLLGGARFEEGGDEGVAFVLDLTERKLAEEALHKIQTELAHVTRVTTLGEMTASIAHELGQPLSAIVANGGACLRWLAGDDPNLNEAREAAQRVIRDGNRASQVITRIRALVRKTDFEKAPLDINPVVQEVINLTQHEAVQKGAALRTELAGDLPLVLGDRVQLQQVILNLIMNGVEAMSSVADRPRELVVRSRRHESDRVLVAVQDSGVGIDRESFKKIFDPFYTTKLHGLGMGLAISRSIIEAHGGRLWAVPNERLGATFQFTLLKYQ